MATAKLSLSFRIFKDGQLVREAQLGQSVIKIGKVTSAHLHIDDEQVSRMHAIIEVVGDTVSVIDLGSTGGTFVNGQRVNKAQLQTGDVIGVGNSRIEFATASLARSTPAGSAESIGAHETVAAAPSVVVAMPPAPPATPARPPAIPRTVTLPAMPAPVVATATPAPVMTAIGMGSLPLSSTDTDEPGAPAVEVAAMLGDSVVGVKHCMDPRGGKITRATWGFAAGGLACLLASGIAFGSSVHVAGKNQDALHKHIEQGKPVRAFRAELVSPAVDVIAFGGLLFGLVGLTTALARARRERKSPLYRIGTAADVEMPVEKAPTPSFPMVAPKGDDFVFNYGAGMEGELQTEGTSITFAELVAQGRAKPSATIAGAFELPIPAKSRIRARAGQTSFLVSAVSKPRGTAGSMFNMESRTLAYGAGSLAAHLAAVALLWVVGPDAAGVDVTIPLDENTLVRSNTKQMEDPVNKPDPETNNGDEGSTQATVAMQLQEGESGKPGIVRKGTMEMKRNSDTEQHMSRDQAIEYARNAGVLGDMPALKGGIASLTSNFDFSNGWSDADIYGSLRGEPGEGGGRFGGGRSGNGPGGGCFGMECGTVGVPYGRIKIDTRPGDGWPGPHGGWGNPRTHVAGLPPGGEPPRVKGDLDRAIIKRYIKRNTEKFAYCYESELLAKPGIEGSVMVSFLISGQGTVQSSTATSTFDPKVGACVASVIKNIDFPAPTDGGNVQVNYPFTFHAAGATQK